MNIELLWYFSGKAKHLQEFFNRPTLEEMSVHDCTLSPEDGCDCVEAYE